jgi:hypothetical protein
LERASNHAKNALLLDFANDVVFMFVDDNLGRPMKSMDAWDGDTSGRREGHILDNLGHLENDSYLSEGGGWGRHNPFSNSGEDEEGGRGEDNDHKTEAVKSG